MNEFFTFCRWKVVIKIGLTSITDGVKEEMSNKIKNLNPPSSLILYWNKNTLFPIPKLKIYLHTFTFIYLCNVCNVIFSLFYLLFCNLKPTTLLSRPAVEEWTILTVNEIIFLCFWLFLWSIIFNQITDNNICKFSPCCRSIWPARSLQAGTSWTRTGPAAGAEKMSVIFPFFVGKIFIFQNCAARDVHCVVARP